MQQNLFHRPPHGKQLHTATVVPSASVDISDCTMWVFFLTPNVPNNPAHLQEPPDGSTPTLLYAAIIGQKCINYTILNQIPALDA